MEYIKIEIGKNGAGKLTSCMCLNYDQFILDSDTLTDSRFEGFRINPKERFHDRIEKVLFEIRCGERALPCRFVMRLESRHSI